MPLSRRQELQAAFLAGGGSVALLLLLYSLNVGIREIPLLGDNQMYFFISERVASGHPPYTSQFDPKNALSVMLWGLAIWIGRVFGLSDVMSARALSLLIIGASTGSIWLVAYRLTGSRKAALLSALAVFSFPGYLSLSSMGCRPKSLVILFALLSINFTSRRKPFWAGFFASLGFLCWQPALLILAALLIALFLGERRWRDVSRAVMGAILPVVLYESYFVLTGTLSRQIEQAVLYPARYMSSEFSGYLLSLRELAIMWVKGFGVLNILPLAFAWGFIKIWADALRRKGGFGDFTQKDRTFLFFALALHGTLVFTYYAHQGYPDYYFAFPFIAIVSGWALARFVDGVSRIAGDRAVRPAVLVLSVALLVPSLIWTFSQRFSFRLSDQYRLAEDVGRFLEEGKTVYCMGCTHLLAFDHSDNWLVHGYFADTVDRYLSDQSKGGIFEPTRNGEWPEIVLLSHYGPAGVRKWLSNRYVEITTEPFLRQNIHVYALKPPGGTPG
jgi:hypothetical protein